MRAFLIVYCGQCPRDFKRCTNFGRDQKVLALLRLLISNVPLMRGDFSHFTFVGLASQRVVSL